MLGARSGETGAYLGVREDFEHRATTQMTIAVAFQQPASIPADIRRNPYNSGLIPDSLCP
jgi:hypothetical protein